MPGFDLARLLGLAVPVVQAPMAGVSTPEMAAAVSDAGGLGSIGIGATNAEGARTMTEEVRARTDRAFNVNLFVPGTPKVDPFREAAWLDWLAPVFGEFEAEPPKALGAIYKSFADDPEMQKMLLEVQPPEMPLPDIERS
jgi:nitronate monooxygenase